MLSRRAFFVCIAGSTFVAACRDELPPKTDGALAPTDPVDPSFVACSKSCGLHSSRDRKVARAQPGAHEGDIVFCPVSGAVFRVASDGPRRTARGMLLYFCCEACAGFFTAHEAAVLDKRGFA